MTSYVTNSLDIPPKISSIYFEGYLMLYLKRDSSQKFSVKGSSCQFIRKKGDPCDPDNYRGITLLSCLGKLFTACISARISTFMDEDNKLGPEQAGFREEFSTSDHIFTLYSIIEYYKLKKGRLYCAFVDYSKAFDQIERSSLWLKLLQNGISGKILNIIKNMYSKAKSCIKSDGKLSEFFSCSRGVRQGENLSPIMFAIYLNDFNTFIQDKCDGLLDLNASCEKQFDIYLRLYVLLYADDTIMRVLMGVSIIRYSIKVRPLFGIR